MNFEKPCGEVWYRRVDDVLACQGTTQGWQGLVEEIQENRTVLS